MSRKKLIKKIAVLSGALILTTTTFLTNITYAQSQKLNMSYIYFGNSSLYSNYVEKTQNSLHVISPNYFNLDEGGNLVLNAIDKNFIKQMHNKNIQVIPFLSNHWNRELGRLALENKEALIIDICEMIEENNLDGINVDIENLTDKDSDDYTEFIKLLRQKLPFDKVLSVAVAPNPYGFETGWQGSYDYKELSKYSDYLIIMSYDESYPGGPSGPVASIEFVEKSIKYALKEVSSEKILLGIPFFGRLWDEEGKIKGQGISMKKVNEMIDEYNSEVIFDESKQSPKVIINIKRDDEKKYLSGKELETGKYTIWYENDESIKSKLRLVQKYNLQGTASWSLGQEDADVWKYYELWLNGQYFNDIEKHWAREAILSMASMGWIKGTSNISFSPDESLTRAQGAVILVRALGLKEKKDMVSNFIDVSNNYWAKKEIDIASQYGIIKGYNDGRFLPGKPITREEMAVMIHRILSNSYESEGNRITYKDINDDRWSYNSILKMTSNEIFKGFEDNTFRPMEHITRGQMATLMDRIAPHILKEEIYFLDKY